MFYKINMSGNFVQSKSARQKVEAADILYFPGGLPDRMMERIQEFGLYDTLRKHEGIVMGYSAGAVIQLAEYHLSPDEDYPEFRYYKGLSYLDDFYLQVHYEAAREQDESIRRVLNERGKTVYATAYKSDALLADNGNIRLLGNVEIFSRK